MTLIQEAYPLMHGQPDSNLQVIADMLRPMKAQPLKKAADIPCAPNRPYRLGILKNQVKMPKEQYDHFNDNNEEIWAPFNEETA